MYFLGLSVFNKHHNNFSERFFAQIYLFFNKNIIKKTCIQGGAPAFFSYFYCNLINECIKIKKFQYKFEQKIFYCFVQTFIFLKRKFKIKMHLKFKNKK